MEYGSVETGIMGFSRPIAAGMGHFDLFWRSYLVEANETGPTGGRVIRITSLFPKKFPLMRYEIGDEVTMFDGDDPRSLHRVQRIVGKSLSFVTMPDGTTNYTRDGAFQVDAQGRLVTATGLPIANGVTVPANAQSIAIGADGVVTAQIPGTVAPQAIGTIALANFLNPGGLEPKGQNLYAESTASGTASSGTPGANGLGALMQGFVETSNVNVVQELVSMIQTQRAYEMNAKAVQTSDQMLQKLGQI
jgi:flagellar hook protein FlgE